MGASKWEQLCLEVTKFILFYNFTSRNGVVFLNPDSLPIYTRAVVFTDNDFRYKICHFLSVTVFRFFKHLSENRFFIIFCQKFFVRIKVLCFYSIGHKYYLKKRVIRKQFILDQTEHNKNRLFCDFKTSDSGYAQFDPKYIFCCLPFSDNIFGQ